MATHANLAFSRIVQCPDSDDTPMPDKATPKRLKLVGKEDLGAATAGAAAGRRLGGRASEATGAAAVVPSGAAEAPLGRSSKLLES